MTRETPSPPRSPSPKLQARPSGAPCAAGRVEVRFFDAQGKEWRIRVEVAGGAMTQEITFHG